MGKKKDKRKQAHDTAFAGAAPLAGIAATLVRQFDTPAARQVIAAGLMAAAGAIAGKDAGRKAPPPVPPVPPVPPIRSQGSGPFAGATPEPPRGDAPALPPEVAKVIGSVAAGLERWATGFGGAKKPDGPAS